MTLNCADDDSYGQFFHSKHFPALKFFIQSGFEVELGQCAMKFKYLVLSKVM